MIRDSSCAPKFIKNINSRLTKRNKNWLAIICGETGCLSQDTILMGYNKSIGKLYKEGEKKVNTYSLGKGNIYYQTTSEIIDSGIKEVYEIEFEDGDKVLATEEHKFFKQKGVKFEEVELKYLKLGDKLRTRNIEQIKEYYKKYNERQKKKTRERFNPLAKCIRCSDEFEQKLGKGYQRCSMCRVIGGNQHIDYKYWKKKVWLPEEDIILIKYYYNKEKDFIISKLKNKRNWKGILKRAYWIGLKRDGNYFRSKYTRKFNLENNPAKRPEVREKMKQRMKEFARKHPKKLINSKLRRNHITNIEKIMKHFLINIFNLKENKDFFFNHYMKVAGTYKFPDFIIPNKKLIIECDGLYWHNQEKDNIRDKLLMGRGYDVLHFTCQQINKKPTEVIQCLQKRLNQ